MHDFDAVYDSGSSFEKVYARIVNRLIKKAKKGDVVYAVPGHPLVGESTVPMLIEAARAENIATKIISGMSFIEPVLEALASRRTPALRSLDPFDGLQLCDAIDLANGHHPLLNPDCPALIAQVYSRAIASDLKLTLMNQYPPMHEVLMVRGGEIASRHTSDVVHRPSSSVLSRVLHELDHHDDFDHLTTLYVPAMPRISSLEGLQETMAHLRAPKGCPWDREQTHQSLRNTLLEETYEVLTAIDEDDMSALKEELGDLLFNVLFQVQMATEAEEFRMVDVIGEVDAKLKRRHPHVFGELQNKRPKANLRQLGCHQKTRAQEQRPRAQVGPRRHRPSPTRVGPSPKNGASRCQDRLRMGQPATITGQDPRRISRGFGR